MSQEPTLTGPIETIVSKPRLRPWVGVAAGAVGTVLFVIGFFAGITSALAGNHSGAGLGTVVFFVGAVLALAGLVLGIVGLVRSASKRVPVIAVVVSLLPVVFYIALVVSVRS